MLKYIFVCFFVTSRLNFLDFFQFSLISDGLFAHFFVLALVCTIITLNDAETCVSGLCNTLHSILCNLLRSFTSYTHAQSLLLHLSMHGPGIIA